MERHHFHFSPYDTITVAQKACFIAGGKYCSPPSQAAQPSTPEGATRRLTLHKGTHTYTQDPLYLAHLGVYTKKLLLQIPV